MNTITAKEFAARLGVSERRVRHLIALNRIPGAIKRAGVWWLPANTRDPRDYRYIPDHKDSTDTNTEPEPTALDEIRRRAQGN